MDFSPWPIAINLPSLLWGPNIGHEELREPHSGVQHRLLLIRPMPCMWKLSGKLWKQPKKIQTPNDSQKKIRFSTSSPLVQLWNLKHFVPTALDTPSFASIACQGATPNHLFLPEAPRALNQCGAKRPIRTLSLGFLVGFHGFLVALLDQ